MRSIFRIIENFDQAVHVLFATVLNFFNNLII